MNRLVVLSGVPGSGKSYFSKTLKTKRYTHLYIISSDQLRALILHNQQNLSEDALIWKIFYGLAKTFSVDHNGLVILDATHTLKKYRYANVKQFRKLYDEIDLIVFNIDKQTVLEQNMRRPHPIPEDKLLGIIDSFEDPDEEEQAFFDHIYYVTGHDIQEIIKNYIE